LFNGEVYRLLFVTIEASSGHVVLQF